MRTTLTLDDDLAGILHRRAKELGKPFKEVVNAVLREGLTQKGPAPGHTVPQIRARHLGLKAGIDPDRLNQLVDELEAEEFARKQR